MLKTGFFSTSYSFEFGARSRDYGYHPSSHQDVVAWFTRVLKFAEPFAVSDNPIAAGVRKAIADEFRGLWDQVPDQLEQVCLAIGANGFWRDGWRAVRQTRNYDGEALPPELSRRLTALDEFLRPKDLIDRVRGTVLGPRGGRLDLDDLERVDSGDYERAITRAANAAEQLGRDLSMDREGLATLCRN
jgi:hypothetical protein